MAKTISPYWKKRITIALGLALVAFVAFLWAHRKTMGVLLLILLSCNPAKKIERDDQKAVSRVNANGELQVPVVNQWLKAHPQSKDTVTITIPGKEIPVPFQVAVRDTARERHIKDSLLAIGKDCGEAAKASFDMGYEEAEKNYKANPVKVKCPDQQIKTITDHSVEDRLTDTIGKRNGRIQFLSGQIDQKDADLKSADHKLSNKNWIIVGLSAIIALLAFGLIKRAPAKIISTIEGK